MIPEAKAKRLLEAIPAWRWLGLKVEKVAEDEAVLRLPYQEGFHNTYSIQGGVIAMLADASIAALLCRHEGTTDTFTTVEFKMSFLRPPGISDLRATGRFVKKGRTLVFAESRVADAEGTEVAVGSFTYMMTGGRKG